MATAQAAARILFIDDEPGIRNFVSRGLRGEGFTVDLAPDGDAGLKAALGPPYDLIILDLLLPDLGGIEVLRRLIRQHPGQPVIVLLPDRGGLRYGSVGSVHEIGSLSVESRSLRPQALCFGDVGRRCRPADPYDERLELGLSLGFIALDLVLVAMCPDLLEQGAPALEGGRGVGYWSACSIRFRAASADSSGTRSRASVKFTATE